MDRDVGVKVLYYIIHRFKELRSMVFSACTLTYHLSSFSDEHISNEIILII